MAIFLFYNRQFTPHASSSLQTGCGACGRTRQLRSQGPASVHAHCTEGGNLAQGARENKNGIRAGIRIGSGNGDGNRARAGNGDVNGDVDGTRVGTGTGPGVETRGRTQDGNGDESEDRNESSSGDGNGDGNEDENEDGVGGGRRRGKNAQEAEQDLYAQGGKRGRLGWKKKKYGQDRVGLVTADPDSLENGKEVGREAQGTHGLSKNCTSRESASSLSCLIRGSGNKPY